MTGELNLGDILGTLPYTAIIGVRKETFEYPDFRKVVIKKLWRPEDAEVTAFYTIYVVDMLEQQQALKAALERKEKLPEDMQMQYGTVTQYLGDALDYLAGMDSFSMEQVNLARAQIAANMARGLLA